MDRDLSFNQKLGNLQLYRKHLHEQYKDRTICWRLQSESGGATDVVTICIDGLDQAKFALPRDPEMRASAALNLDLNKVYQNMFLFVTNWLLYTSQ